MGLNPSSSLKIHLKKATTKAMISCDPYKPIISKMLNRMETHHTNSK